MQTNIKKYLFFCWTGLFIVLIAMGFGLWKEINQNPLERGTLLDVKRGQQFLVVDTLEQYSWVGFEPVERLKIESFQLVIGTHRLSFQHDSIGNKIYYVPTKAFVWKNYFASFLLSNTHISDSVAIWKEVKQTWAKPFEKELKLLENEPTWKQLSDEQQLAHVLVSQLLQYPQRMIVLHQGELRVYPESINKEVPQVGTLQMNQEKPSDSPYYELIFILFGIGMGIIAIGIWITSSISTVTNTVEANNTPQMLGPTEPHLARIDLIETTSPQAPSGKKEEASSIEQYLTQFYERYGDLFASLHDIPVEFKPEDKQRILQSLVEMALHAHSLARQYHHTQSLEKIHDDLNVLLVSTNQHVKDFPISMYQVYEEDPEKTKKAYRMFVRLIREIGVRQLEGVLLNNVYVPSTNLLEKS